MDTIYKLNLEKAIASQKDAIAHLKSESSLSEIQLSSGRDLCKIYDSILKNGVNTESYAQLRVFEHTAALLDYDYQEAMEYQREKYILDMYEECQEVDGFIVEMLGYDYDNLYYAFSDGAVYFWTASNNIIKEIPLDKVPDCITEKEGFTQLLANGGNSIW